MQNVLWTVHTPHAHWWYHWIGNGRRCAPNDPNQNSRISHKNAPLRQSIIQTGQNRQREIENEHNRYLEHVCMHHMSESYQDVCCFLRCSSYFKVSKGVSRYPEVSKGVLRCPRCFKVFQGVPRCSNVFQGVPRCSKVFQATPRCSKVPQGVQMCPNVSQGVPRYPKVFQGVPRYPKVFQGVPRCP